LIAEVALAVCGLILSGRHIGRPGAANLPGRHHVSVPERPAPASDRSVDMAVVPIDSSPLKVRHRDSRFVAETADGMLAFDGAYGASGGPELLACETANGTWHVQRRADHGDGKYNDVLDRSGHSVARIERHGLRTSIVLTSGEQIPVTSGNLTLFGHGCRVGRLAKARAPFLRPGRYFKLKLSDELLARPDRELLVVLAAHLAEGRITASIQASLSS
jgi:hypothetical protein